MADFSYVKPNQSLGTISAPDPATALKDISPISDPHSGVVSPPLTQSQLSASINAYNGGGDAAAQAAAAKNALTSSSGTSRIEEGKTGNDIATASDPAYLSPTNDTNYITEEIQRLGERTSAEFSNINSAYDALRKETEAKQERETGSSSAGLARMGGYLGGSGSGTGVMLSLAESHRGEIIGLENKRQQALADARNAFEDKNFELAKLKVGEAKAVEQEAYNRKQTYLKQVSEAHQSEAKQKAQVDIYNTIADGTNDPLEIFSKLGGRISIDDINTFLKGATPKDASGGFAYTPTQTARLIGSGLSAKDINAAQQYINENGYTEEFRSQLSAAQKVAFDSVYREKAAADAKAVQPLGILDIQRYNDLYPDAGIQPGDTEATANAKVAASNTPEAKTRSLVLNAKENGHSYDDVVSEINKDSTIKDKETAIAIAKQVYGVADQKPEDSKINKEIAQLSASGILTTADIRYALKKRGYSQDEINNSTAGSIIDQIGSFLFKT